VTTLQALLVFVGIPVGAALVVFVLVSASSWTRSGRTSADYDGGPFLISSEPAVPNPSIVDRPSTSVAGGGVSGTW
jgi:hypothetical protein